MMQKKGAIEFSMTTIIVVIIGVLILAIAIPWLTGTLRQAGGLTDAAFTKALQELKGKATPSDRLVLSQEDFTLGIGDQAALAVGYLVPTGAASVLLSFDDVANFVDYKNEQGNANGQGNANDLGSSGCVVDIVPNQVYEWRVTVDVQGGTLKDNYFGSVTAEAYSDGNCGTVIADSSTRKPLTFIIN